jgi:hypothetical protein
MWAARAALCAICATIACVGEDPTPRLVDGMIDGGDASGGVGGSPPGTGQDAMVIQVGDARPAGEAGSLEDAACVAVRQQAEVTLQPADIIWAEDSSTSMENEAASVQRNMNRFTELMSRSGIDVRLVVIGSLAQSSDGGNPFDTGVCIPAPLGSGNCTNDTNLPHYLHVLQYVGSDALDQIVATYPKYRSMLRPEATKTFVVVTDDDALGTSIVSAAAFTRSVAMLDPSLFAQWTFDGIYCFTDCPEGAKRGAVYEDLRAQTGGVAGDLCKQDFAPVFDRLATGVVAATRLACEWAIPPAPAGQTLDPSKVNVRYTTPSGATEDILNVPPGESCGPSGGWFYDDPTKPTKILVCPSTCATLQSTKAGTVLPRVDVLFGCRTVIVK